MNAENFTKAIRIQKMIQLGIAGIMIFLAVMRTILITRFDDLINFVMTVYLYGLSILLILIEFEVVFIKEQFYLLNYGWGKAFLNLFLGLSCVQFEIGMWP